jgi:uncharacterized repeat protein (TIGR01451 family)
MKHLARTITILALLALTAPFALAEGEISLVMEAQEEVERINQEGKKETQYIEPDSIIPGDVVLYTIHYHNQGDKPAEAVFITNPIPENMQYLNEITPFSDTMTTFSVDGGKTFNTPDKLFITMADSSKRPATTSDYTNIKWRFNNPLPPDSKGAVGYRARLK